MMEEKLKKVLKNIIGEFVDRYQANVPWYPNQMERLYADMDALWGEEDVSDLDFSWKNPAPQSQASLSDQLFKLIPVANQMGLYDAADYIKSRDEYLLKMEKELKDLKTLVRSAAESDNCYDILFEYLKKH